MSERVGLGSVATAGSTCDTLMSKEQAASPYPSSQQWTSPVSAKPYPPPPEQGGYPAHASYAQLQHPSSNDMVTLPPPQSHLQQEMYRPHNSYDMYQGPPPHQQQQPPPPPPPPHQQMPYPQQHPNNVGFNQPAPRQRTAIACRYCRRRKVAAPLSVMPSRKLLSSHASRGRHRSDATASTPPPTAAAPTACASTRSASSHPCRRRRTPSCPPTPPTRTCATRAAASRRRRTGAAAACTRPSTAPTASPCPCRTRPGPTTRATRRGGPRPRRRLQATAQVRIRAWGTTIVVRYPRTRKTK